MRNAEEFIRGIFIFITVPANRTAEAPTIGA